MAVQQSDYSMMDAVVEENSGIDDWAPIDEVPARDRGPDALADDEAYFDESSNAQERPPPRRFGPFAVLLLVAAAYILYLMYRRFAG